MGLILNTDLESDLHMNNKADVKKLRKVTFTSKINDIQFTGYLLTDAFEIEGKPFYVAAINGEKRFLNKENWTYKNA